MMSTTERPSQETAIGHCPLCGAKLESPDHCEKCDWVRAHGDDYSQPMRANPVDLTACLLSLVPGLGHYYKGHTGLGIFYAALTLVVTFFCILAGSASAGFGLLLLPFYWAWVMTHAYWVEDLKAGQRAVD